MSLTMQKSVKFERLLIGYISKCKDQLSISIVASISQPYLETQFVGGVKTGEWASIRIWASIRFLWYADTESITTC